MSAGTTAARLGSLATAMVTPFDDAGRVDLGRAVEVAEHLIATGTDALVVAGTTGESPTLDHDETLALFRAIAGAVRGRAAVWGGTGSNDTRRAVAFTREASETGIDAILAVAPYYNRPPQDGLRAHFGAIAAATELPVVVYNVPSRTGVNVLPATLRAIADDHANVAAVKESSGDLAQMSRILAERRDGFRFFCGDDHLFLPSLAIGADGLVSVASHVAGRELRAMLEAFRAGDVARAGALHRGLSSLFAALFATASPIPVKWAMGRIGLPCGPCRPPLGAMPAEVIALLEPLLAHPERGLAGVAATAAGARPA